MDFFTLVLLGGSLSMDAFAVSVTHGIQIPQLKARNAIKVGVFFGGFQALMPFVGWLLGRQVYEIITAYDHWIVFALLCMIGGKMIWDATRKEEHSPDQKPKDPTKTGTLLVLAIATSIDALAVGISLALVDANILISAGVIGVITFVLCVLGVLLGKKLGVLFQKRATILGGIALVLIGARILLEHLFM